MTRNLVNKILTLLLIFIGIIFLQASTGNVVVTYNSLDELPATVGKFDVANRESLGTIADITFTKSTNDLYNLKMNYKNETWFVNNVSLNADDVTLKDSFSGFYWTEVIEGEDVQFVAFATDGAKSNYQYLLEAYEDQDIQPFQAWAVWNLNTNEVVVESKMKIFGVINDVNGLFYVDLVLDVPNDDIISVVMEFERRFKTKNGFWPLIPDEWSEWDPVKDYVAKKEETTQVGYNMSLFRRAVGGGSDIWSNFKAGFVVGATFGIGYAVAWKSWESEVSIISKLEYNDSQQAKYVSTFNKQVEDNVWRNKYLNGASVEQSKVTVGEVFGVSNNVYRIYLDSINYEQKDYQYRQVAVIDLAYKYDGTIYHVAHENIWSIIPDYQPPTFEDKADGFWNKIKDFLQNVANWFKKNKWWFIGIGLLIGAGFVAYFFGPAIREGSKQFIKSRKVRSKKSRKKPTKRKGKR